MTVQQHLKRFYKLSLLLLVAGICLPAVAQSQQYATKRLAHIDALLQKATLRHALNCRKNSFQEVEHLGLLLFPQQIRNLKPSPVYDFLERYLLELNIAKDEERERLLMQYSVTFATGTPATALTIDTTFTYTEHELEYHRYMASWEQNGKAVLQIIFPKNWQLLSGCAIPELEDNMEKKLQRHIVLPLPPLPVEGKWMVTPLLNNKLYVSSSTPLKKGRKNGEEKARNYVFSGKEIAHSVANLMLADDMNHSVQLHLLVNRHNFVTDTMTVSLITFLNFCRSVEGCTPFFGIKQRKEHHTEGLLVLANKQAGFVHTLAVDIDDAILTEGKGSVTGKLMPYIPIYNIKKEYLNLTEYDTNP